MKYFTINNKLFHCSDIFNHCRIDLNGHVMLYQNVPFPRKDRGYWTSGHTDSFDLTIFDPESPIKSIFDLDIKVPYTNWLTTIIEVK